MNGAAFRFKWEVRDQASGGHCYRTYLFREPAEDEPEDTREFEPADDLEGVDVSRIFIAALANGVDGGVVGSNDVGSLGLRREYLPLVDFPELFLTFSNTPLTVDGVLSFASKFGVLGLGEIAEPLSAWFEEIQLLHQLVELWTAYQGQDRNRLTQLTRLAKVPLDEISDINDALGQVLEVMDHAKLHRNIRPKNSQTPVGEVKSLDHVVLEHISTKIEAHLSPLARPILYIDEKKSGLVLNVAPVNLLGAIWLQFAMAVTSNKRYADCVVCGQPFEIKKGVKKTCSDRCRQALSRSKRNTNS